MSPRTAVTAARLLSDVEQLLLDAGDIDTLPADVHTDVLTRLGKTGALGALVPAEYGGGALSYLAYGELSRTVAEKSASLQSVLTVHGMVCRALTRWGAAPLRTEFLPDLAAGTTVGAFALSEEEAGSDVRRVATTARRDGDSWVLSGHKKWITFGAVAEVFLVFAVHEGRDLAVLVRRQDPGVEILPAPAMSGFRGARLAELRLRECRVPADRLLGRQGAALSHIATDALTLGRLCVAYGAYGLAREATEAALACSIDRQQFGGPLHRLQLVRGLLSDAVVATEAAGLMCERAARALDDPDDRTMSHVLTAKLSASRAATTAAQVAAQLHGAAGLVADSPVDRYVRDARVLEVIEGNTQLLQHLVAEQALARHRVRRAERDARARART
ncbi:acyl-CoA dehydrogenase family protein [Streptomyces sp. NPDC046909]|uniref:acyl-CoA dehydrogenase family protein n=1 Tax=Streptomyces sp. NPDC046909 TaxID=3155617 RepID=UPI0034062F4D